MNARKKNTDTRATKQAKKIAPAPRTSVYRRVDIERICYEANEVHDRLARVNSAIQQGITLVVGFMTPDLRETPRNRSVEIAAAMRELFEAEAILQNAKQGVARIEAEAVK